MKLYQATSETISNVAIIIVMCKTKDIQDINFLIICN